MKSRLLYPLATLLYSLTFILCALLAAVPVRATTDFSESVVDPYVILNQHYRAIGGLEKLRSIRTSYSEGQIRHDGLTGTFREWEARPLQYRFVQDYGTIRQTEGDSGEYAWFLDTNGQVLIHKDPEIFKRREIGRLLDRYEHLNRDSKYFKVSYGGVEDVDGHASHKVQLTNRINSDKMVFYFDTSNFLLRQTVVEQPDTTIISSFDDYRRQDGIIIAFHTFTRYLPWEKEEEVRLKTYSNNPPVDPSIFAIPAVENKYRFTGEDANKKASTISFTFIENLIYLPVTINGDTKYWVVDSGASMSLIDTDYARSLGLEISGSIQGYGFGDLFQLSFVTVPEHRMGNIIFDNQKLYGSEGLATRSYDPEIHGILGYDFLSRFVVEIDYDNKEITLHKPESFNYGGDGVILEAPLKYRTFTLPVTLNHKYQSKWTVDLGSYRSSIHYKYAAKYGLLDISGVDSVSQGLTSISRETTAQLSCLAIAEMQLDHPLITVPWEKGKGATALGEVGGNLGNSTLQHFHLWLNYPQQQVILERGQRYNNQRPRDRSGLLVGRDENSRPMVSFVASKSPAAEAGVLAGDLIAEINTAAVGPNDSTVDLRTQFRQPGSQEMELSLIRGNKTIRTKFALEDLYPSNQHGCPPPGTAHPGALKIFSGHLSQ